MAEIYGNTTTTPINPNAFGGVSTENIPRLFTGTSIVKVAPEEFFCVETEIGTGGELENAKVGDLYFNTDANRYYGCVKAEKVKHVITDYWATHWIGLNYNELLANGGNPDIDLSGKMDKFGEVVEDEASVWVIPHGNKMFKFIFGNSHIQTYQDNFSMFVKGTNVKIDENGLFVNFVKMADVDYVDGFVGDIETALDNIIAIQNNLIGGDGV